MFAICDILKSNFPIHWQGPYFKMWPRKASAIFESNIVAYLCILTSWIPKCVLPSWIVAIPYRQKYGYHQSWKCTFDIQNPQHHIALFQWQTLLSSAHNFIKSINVSSCHAALFTTNTGDNLWHSSCWTANGLANSNKHHR